MTVLLAGGGSAGHVNPLLALADTLRAENPDQQIVVIGTADGLEAELVPAAGYELQLIEKVPLPRRPNRDLLALPVRLRRARSQVIDLIRARKVEVVVGFGGYVSPPAYLAAKKLGIPVVIHEQNARPGIANKLGAKWAHAVAVTFAATPLPGSVLTGLPLRPQIARVVAELDSADRAEVRRAARTELGLDEHAPLLLVTGGSLGAQHLNEVVSELAPELLGAGVQVLHLTGKGKLGPVRSAVETVAGAENYHAQEYCDRMELAIVAADLVLCRSGAGSVSELAAIGAPAVLVPLPIGNGEQRLNAQDLLGAGGALLVEDAQFDAAWFRNHAAPLLTTVAGREELANMAAKAHSVGVRDGAHRLAELVREARGAGK